MDSIRIKNLRSFVDTNEIQLKPLTVLVGGNGSGKSTFLRTFPLIRQSFEKNINGPILWSGGEKGLVDFGDFDTSLNFNAPNHHQEIVFCFKYRNKFIMRNPFVRKVADNEKNIAVEISIAKLSKIDYVKQLEIRINSHTILISISSSKITDLTINNIKIDCSNEKMRVTNAFIPQLDRFTLRENTFFEKNRVIISNIFSGIMEEKPIEYERDILAHIFFLDEVLDCCNKNDFIQSIANNKKLALKEEKLISDFLDEEKFIQFSTSIIALNLSNILETINAQVESLFKNVKYITPLRATARRSTVANNLAVEEIDSQGENMAVFLNSLKTENKLEKFQKWTQDNFGFKVSISEVSTYLSIKIQRVKKEKEKAVNMADTGFGYSQILPIITQLWVIINRQKPKAEYVKYNSNTIIYAIEQPELHLHPALQATLIDVFSKSIAEAKKNKINLIILIETHSETMVNRIGYNIYKKQLDAKDVNVVLFEKDFETSNTKVSTTGFDNEGYVIDWPCGFFTPEEI